MRDRAPMDPSKIIRVLYRLLPWYFWHTRVASIGICDNDFLFLLFFHLAIHLLMVRMP